MEPVSTKVSVPLTEGLDEGHTYAAMPPIVDGAPVLTPLAPLKVLRDEDWICLRGPCRMYMRLEHQIDSERPREDDGKLATHYADGTKVKPFTSVLHVCYPSPGIEIAMRDEVVTDCNLWDPLDPEDEETAAREARRASYHRRAAQVALDIPAAMPTTRAEAEATIRSMATLFSAFAAHRGLEHVPTGGNRPGGTFASITCSCGEPWVITAEAGKTIRDADRKAVIEAIKLIGPPKLERAAPVPPPSSAGKLTPGTATEALWKVAVDSLGKTKGHSTAVHIVQRAVINDNGTLLRITCTCGEVVAWSSAHMADPRSLERIVAAGVKNIP